MPGGEKLQNPGRQDVHMQLMLLENQNKKRLMAEWQEQDNMFPRTEGGQGASKRGRPNGQPSQGTPPKREARIVNSRSPEDRMKRGIPQKLTTQQQLYRQSVLRAADQLYETQLGALRQQYPGGIVSEEHMRQLKFESHRQAAAQVTASFRQSRQQVMAVPSGMQQH
jgi:hypothetical protein